MFRSGHAQNVYEQFLKRGLCKDHAAEFNQTDNSEECNEELSRKALLFIRVGILDPILFQKPAKCAKIKFLMQKTSYFSHNPTDVPDEAYDSILVLDSVVVFTLCHLSKICCIGALFQSSLKTSSEDPEKRFLQNLLQTERLTETDISHLNPLLQQKFAGDDIDLIKVCYAATLLFVRNVCIKLNIKSALESVEKEILCYSASDIESYKRVAENSRKKHNYTHAIVTYSVGLKTWPYSAELYAGRGAAYARLQKLEPALLDFCVSLMIKPTCESFLRLCSTLVYLQRYKEIVEIADFALRSCQTRGCKFCIDIEDCKNEHEQLLKKKLVKKELCNGVSKQFVSDKLPQNDNSFPELVEDSDSTESESESGPVLIDASDDCESSDTEEDISEITCELKTKPEVNTPTGAKKPNANKQKRTTDKPSLQVEEKECVDITVINLYLKEASEALLEDCGYKALKLFRGPLISIIDSPKLYSTIESEIVCLKYSYGLAYYQSGEYDDLQKCITIFKEIIEKHDSITFPAAYYVLGLAYRKLNRFKEALVYLENVKSILDKGIHCKVYPWPALTAVINETKSKVLKVLVNDLIKDCENPPNPNAICRFPECQVKSIYYTDPDFKGYMSIFCSEQCCLQYHLQCWKYIRTDKKLTDKEFLEQQCFTPDCDGVIIKVQSIDKKGDISKEFLSDVKKVPKQKWAKWDKKTETKEKDKKKKRAHSSRSESRDPSSECEVISRKNSDVNEGSVSSLESSAATNTNQEEHLPINQNEQQKFAENSEMDSGIFVNSEPVKDYQNFTVPELPQSQNISQTYDIEPLQDNGKYLVSQCITNNIYSYMADFLQFHGPLKIDDPTIINEMSTFPEDVFIMITDCGGIGEFLKNDLRFAYVGDTYVCVVSDLGRAYSMHSNSSLPTNIDCLNSAEDSDYAKIRLFYNNEPYETFGLNPDATEYEPTAASETNENAHFKFTGNSNSDISTNSNFVTKTYELFPASENDTNKFQSFNNLCSSKIFDKKTDDNFSSKSISLQVLPSKELEPSNSKARRKLFEEFKPNLDTSGTDLKKLSESSSDLKSEVIQTFQSVGENVLSVLNSYFSESMEPHRHALDSFIEPYIIKKINETTNTGTITDELSLGTPEDYADLDEAKSLSHTLNVENEILNEQKSLLQEQLTMTEQQKIDLATEVINLKKKLEDSAAQLETLKNDNSEKEKQLESGRKYLLESLTHAHETIAKQRKDIELWKSEKSSITNTIDELKISLEVAEKQFKSNVEETETKHAAIRNNLQSENATLKARALFADRQFLSFKKSEYLKRIEEKILQARQRSKELTDGLSMMCGNLNPMLETSMKSLSTELLTYENKLSAAKFSFTMKIDEQIKKIESGASLLNMEEIKMETIPDIPCWKSLLPSNSSNFDKLVMSSNQMPFNFGWNAGTLPGLAAVAPPATTVTPPLATAAPPLAIADPPLATAMPPPKTAPISKTPGRSSNFEINKKGNSDKKSEPLDILNFNPDIQESYKSAMASINSFASTPLSNSVPSLEDDLSKNFVDFKQPTPAVSNSSMDTPKVPPGIRQPLLPTPTRQPLLPTPIQKSVFSTSTGKIPPVDVHGSNTSLEAMSFSGPDPVPKVSTELERKAVASGKNNYEKLLFRLKEQYSSYSEEELMSFVKEFRMQRQGKLSGLPIDTIISRIGDIIKARKNAEKKAGESKTLSKSNKILVNKKLVPDAKPKDPSSQSGIKKKCPWNIESDSQKQWTGNDNCEECVICYNEMEEGKSYKVACGHVFHEVCIRQWLNEKSDCPICRVLLLLPEDYPSLS